MPLGAGRRCDTDLVTDIDDDLMAECDVQVCRADDSNDSRSAAVRVIHRPTGIVVGATKESTPDANRDAALRILRQRLSEE